MKYIILSLSLGLVMLSSCKNTASKEQTKTTVESTTTAEQSVVGFDAPDIPLMLTNPEDRAGYLRKHYWDNFDSNDTLLLNNEEYIEQKWVDYLDLLYRFQDNDTPKIVSAFFEKLKDSPQANKQFYELADKYLYESDSPFRNDPLYVEILKVKLNDKNTTEIEKQQLTFKYDLFSKNNVGDKALNINFTTPNGQKQSLHRLTSDYVILFFNDLECNVCISATEKLKQSELISSLLQKGKLKLVTINSEDDIQAWKEKVSTWPSSWTNGYDTTVIDNNSYDLRALPSFYLLDKDKKVVLKDKTIEEIIATLEQLQ